MRWRSCLPGRGREGPDSGRVSDAGPAPGKVLPPIPAIHKTDIGGRGRDRVAIFSPYQSARVRAREWQIS